MYEVFNVRTGETYCYEFTEEEAIDRCNRSALWLDYEEVYSR